MSDFYAELVRLILSTKPPGTERARLNVEWYDGVIHGPAVSYFDGAGGRLRNPMGMSESRALGKHLHTQREAERKQHAQPDGTLPNVYELTVNVDGSYTPVWRHDPGAQARLDAETRAKLGDEEYERLQRPWPPTPTAPQVLPPEADEADEPDDRDGEPMTIPELLGFIQQELAKDAPAGWTNIHVDGEVWSDGAVTHVKAVYSCQLKNDDRRHPFTASNVLGPMNAVKELQRQMADGGDAWRHIRLEFTAGSTRTLIDTK